MNIQCPNCETIFDLQKNQKTNNKYKCSVCNHVWIEKEDKSYKISIAEASNFKIIFLLNIAIFLLVILAVIIFRNYLENIDSNWKSIYVFFDMLIPI